MRKLLAAAVSFAMCVSFLPPKVNVAAELISAAAISDEAAPAISSQASPEAYAAKTTTKTAAKTTSKTTAKTTAKTTSKTTGKSTSKTTAKTTVKTTTKKPVSTTVKSTAPKTTVTTTAKITTTAEAPYMLGDIDNDKKITGSDATWILREYTLISSGTDGELTKIQKNACDVDSDGRITGSDATLTLSYYTYQGSGGVLEFEDFMKYGPIDIGSVTTTAVTTQSTTATTTTTSTSTEATTTTTTVTETSSTTTTVTDDPYKVKEIKLSHYEVTLDVGGGDMALVTMYPETALDKSEKWWSSDTSIATVNYEGWIVGIAPGECTVTVQSVDNPDVTAEIKVTVIDNKVTEIKLDKYEVVIPVGKGDMPLVTMLPESAPDKSERWWSSDESVATVNSEGWIVGIAPGECTVTVRSINNPDVTAEIKVTVTDEGLVKEIVLNKYEVELTVGKGDMPLVTMLPSDAEDKSEIWWSSDASIATVNYEGWIVGTGIGECTVTVQSAANPKIKAEIKVIVKAE